MTVDVKGGPYLDQLNVLYALCLTVVLTFTFHVSVSPTPSVEPTAQGRNILPILTYLLYFMLDWATVNAIRRQGLETWAVLWLEMVTVPFLCIVILSLYSLGIWKYLAVGIFETIVSALDIFFYARLLERNVSTRPMLGLLRAVVKMPVALFILVPAVIANCSRADVVQSNEYYFMFLTLCILVVLLKLHKVWDLAIL
jgi:hypothetical protein